LLQVADKAEGALLGDVLRDPDKGYAAIDPASLSETVVFTILTTADDAKGDNFMVTADGVITGIDNDHVLGLPYVVARWLSVGGADTTAAGDDSMRDVNHIVEIKNVLLCHADVLSAPVHPDVVKHLQQAPIETILVEWLASMADYDRELRRLYADGSLPRGWVAVDLGPRNAAARILFLWDAMRRTVTSNPDGVTHGDLFRVALPRVYDYYEHVRYAVRGERASEAVLRHVYFGKDSLLEHERILHWLYYQSSYANIEPDKRSAAPRPHFMHDDKVQATWNALPLKTQREHVKMDVGNPHTSAAESNKSPLCDNALDLLTALLKTISVGDLAPSAVRIIVETILLKFGDPHNSRANSKLLPENWRESEMLLFRLIQARVTNLNVLSLVAKTVNTW
jgi:hypothetical protein